MKNKSCDHFFEWQKEIARPLLWPTRMSAPQLRWRLHSSQETQQNPLSPLLDLFYNSDDLVDDSFIFDLPQDLISPFFPNISTLEPAGVGLSWLISVNSSQFYIFHPDSKAFSWIMIWDVDSDSAMAIPLLRPIRIVIGRFLIPWFKLLQR